MTEAGAHPVPWSVAGRSAIGAMHIEYGIANQDAFAWRPPGGEGGAIAVAVADGHGAALHFRSAIGAHIAVDAATEILAEIVADPDWMRVADWRAVREAGRRILSRWRRDVEKHLAENPVGPEAEGGRARPGGVTAYGTTLIAAAATADGICALQVGDGDLLLGRADGTVFRPLPDDVGLVGEQTYSLCQDDAEAHMRAIVLRREDADIDFLLLATDGVSKSFADERTVLDLAAGWRAAVAASGLAAVDAHLGEWLSRTSREGSGDDMTMVLAARLPAARSSTGAPALPGQQPRRRSSVAAAVHERRRPFARSIVTALVSAVAAAAVAVGAYVMLVR